jgi:archaellum component FlaC
VKRRVPDSKAERGAVVDKKAKKKIDVLHDRITKLRQQLAGAKKQMDDPEEVERLERDIVQAQTELDKLKS